MAKRHKKKSAEFSVSVDATLKRLWDKQSKIIADALARDASAFDERWEAAAAIVEHDPPLYVVGAHKSAAEFFRNVLHEAPRTAFRNMRVAKYFSPREEAEHGVAKLDLLLSFLEAKQEKPLGGALPLHLARVRIPVRAGKAVPFGEATSAHLRAATKHALGGASRARKKGKLQSAIEDALAKTDALTDVQVHESGGFVSVRRIPVGAFQAFVASLRRVRET